MRPSRRSQPSASIARATPLEDPLPEVTPAVPNSRKFKTLIQQGRSRLHRFVKYRIVETTWFNLFIVSVIVLNAITLALDTGKYFQDNWSRELDVLEDIFLAIYTIELVLKVYADPINYWFSFANLFDFVIVFLSLIQIFVVQFYTKITGLQILRVFRIIRTFRIFRTVRFVKGLEVCVQDNYQRRSYMGVGTLGSTCVPGRQKNGAPK